MKIDRDKVANVCNLFANGVLPKDISKELNIPYTSVTQWISKYYLGKVRTSTPVHIIKQSKV